MQRDQRDQRDQSELDSCRDTVLSKDAGRQRHVKFLSLSLQKTNLHQAANGSLVLVFLLQEFGEILLDFKPEYQQSWSYQKRTLKAELKACLEYDQTWNEYAGLYWYIAIGYDRNQSQRMHLQPPAPLLCISSLMAHQSVFLSYASWMTTH